MAVRKDLAKALADNGYKPVAKAVLWGGKHVGRPVGKALKKKFS